MEDGGGSFFLGSCRKLPRITPDFLQEPPFTGTLYAADSKFKPNTSGNCKAITQSWKYCDVILFWLNAHLIESEKLSKNISERGINKILFKSDKFPANKLLRHKRNLDTGSSDLQCALVLAAKHIIRG